MMPAATERLFAWLAALGLLLGCGAPAAAEAASLGSRVPVSAACPAPSSQIIVTSVPSAVYGKDVPVSVYLPPCYDPAGGKLPVVYLLHGGNADETQWPDLRVQTEADSLVAGGAAPFVVAMPGGVYRDGLDYAAFVLGELFPAIEQQFAVSAHGADRAIGGISLGGYWALKLAFRHPEQFAAAGGNSPVVSMGAADDPLPLARTGTGLDALRIRLDVGDGDSMRDSTSLLADVLRAHGLAVELSVQPGYHNRTYWRSHTHEYLAFYLSALHPTRTCHHRPSYSPPTGDAAGVFGQPAHGTQPNQVHWRR